MREKARDGIRSHRGAPTLVGHRVDSFPDTRKAVPEFSQVLPFYLPATGCPPGSRVYPVSR